ncbi:MAG: SMC family ATPase [Clostridia bacterium]|nr:SMC family ATPase [Clostridia bacterium]
MKPIYLEIEGLQSYKSLQKIDFQTLTKSGLFGIFGNTGSGKSTILDAITLALYGKVNRASRGTQGIMNNECDTMRVLFVFSLMQKGVRNTYKIERVYGRKTENTYESKISRMFLCKKEGDLPIAEKITDIETAVKELIGLEYEDFTRAVVLPQNKFQEFLTMEKAKKLSMLERLFALEEYGERLNESVKVKLYELEKEYEGVKGKLSAYENSDDDALKSAEEKVAALEEKREIELKKFKTVEEEYLKVKDLYETSANILKLENELATANSEKDYYDRIREKLSLSAKAKEVEPLWNEYKAEALKIKEREKKLEALRVEKENTESKLEKSENRCKIADQNASVDLPKLYDRKSRLEQSTDLQDRNDSLIKSIEENTQKAEALKAEMLSTAGEKNGNQIRRNEINEKINAHDAFSRENRPKLEKRRVLMEARKLESELNSAKEIAENAKKNYESLQEEKEKLEKDYEDTRVLKSELEEKREKRKASVESTIKQYKSFKADYIAEKEKLEKEVEELYLDQSSYNLSLTLKDAVPCPVCGSMHHPSPAKLNQESSARMQECKEEIQRFNKEIEDADKIILGFTNGYNNEKKAEVLVEIENLTHDIAAASTKLELITERLSQISAKVSGAKNNAEETLKIYHEKNNEYTRFISLNGIADIGKTLAELDEIEKNISGIDEEIYALRKENEKLTQEFNVICEKQSKLDAQLSAADATIREQTVSLGQVKTQLFALSLQGSVYEEIIITEGEISSLVTEQEESKKERDALKNALENVAVQSKEIVLENAKGKERLDAGEKQILAILKDTEIKSPDVILQAKLSDDMEKNYHIEVNSYDENLRRLCTSIAISKEKVANRKVTSTEYDVVSKKYEKAALLRDEIISGTEVARNEYEKLKENNRQWKIVSENHKELSENIESYNLIKKLISGNKFVEYVAEESLRYVLLEASEILSSLTCGRYRIELGTDSNFVIRDYLSGGSYRDVSTLSGGETFLTSLSLAIALSKQIQLKGQSPLEFFFLDEGFGSLDGQLLDTVMDALETLASSERIIGVVSHLKEMQERISSKLCITKDTYNSSSVKTEIL